MSTVGFGAKFSLEGATRAMGQMRGLHTQYRKLSHTIDRGSGRIGSSFRGMGTSLRSGVIALGGAQGALLAFKAAVAATLGVLVKQSLDARANLTALYHDLRALGKTSEDLKLLEGRMMDFTDAYSGMSTAKAVEGIYKTASATSDLDTATQATLATTTALMAKLSKFSPEEGARYLTSWLGKYRDFIKGDVVKATQEFAAQTAAVVNLANTEGRELQNAMEESLAVLSQMGWSAKRQVAIAGAMTEALPGSQVDTILGQMAGKSGRGYGKLMAMLDKRWQDTDQLKGKAKSSAIRTNKALRAHYAGIGAELWATDPHKYLEKVDEALQVLKKRDKNWFRSIAEEGYEEEVAKGLLTLIAKRKRFAELESQLADATWKNAMKRAKATDVDLAARKKLYEQRKQNLMLSLGRVLEPTAIKMYDWLGEKLMGGRQALTARLDDLQKIVGTFAENVWQSFSRAFQINPEFSGWLNKVVGLLNKPDSGEWAKMGQDLGRMAGVNLSKLVEAMNLLMRAAQGLWQVLGPIARTLAWIAEKSLGGWAKLSEHFDEIADEFKPLSEAYKKHFAEPLAGLMNRAQGKVFGAPQPDHPGLRAAPRPAAKPLGPGPILFTPMMRAEMQRRRAAREQAAATPVIPKQEIRIEVPVQIDGREVGRAAAKYSGEQRDARGFTYGEAWAQ